MQTSIDKVKWLQLIRSEGIGPKKFWQLLRQHQSVENVLSSLSTVYEYNKAADEISVYEKKGFHLLTAFDPHFPSLLRRLSDCPPLLSVCGNLDSLKRPMLAIVGARNASLTGRQISFRMAQELGKSGWQIISGLARGIDERAHQGALNTGTIAVLAGGIDCIYPAEHHSLYHKIIDNNGAIISEMPLGTAAISNLFPRRNRLIAGLSQAVIVIEAALKSGSLITAEFALEQGVEIFAVPGSPLDPRCLGSNKLLKHGATLVENAEDVLNVVGIPHIVNHSSAKTSSKHLTSQAEEKIKYDTIDVSIKDLRGRVLTDLNQVPLEFEQITSQYNCSATQLLSLLSELEIEGLVHRHSGNRFSLTVS